MHTHLKHFQVLHFLLNRIINFDQISDMCARQLVEGTLNQGECNRTGKASSNLGQHILQPPFLVSFK
jgi:hypothetical protein